jgi:hypothetical protein
MNMKWIGVIVLAIIGILAAIVGILYLTESIHSLPSMLGGKTALVHGHPPRGHYHKRGYVSLVIAVVALGGAAYWAYRIRVDSSGPAASSKAGTTTPASSADSLLSSPQPGAAPEAPSQS